MKLETLMRCEERVRNGPWEVPPLPSLEQCPPEMQRCVARILLAQHLRGDDVFVPQWRDVKGLSVEVELAFLGLELAMVPVTFADVHTPLVLEALLRICARDIRVEEFSAVVDLCLARDESRFHEHALALIVQQAERVDPRSLLGLYERLLDTSLAPLAVDRLVAMGGTVPAYAALQGHHRSLAAVRAHGFQGDRVLLLRLAADASLSEDVRIMAVTALGHCAHRQDLDALLEVCRQQPERLASACLSALVDLRHRGIFLQAAHLLDLFELALHAPFPLAALTAHLVEERRELLMRVALDDPRLPVWLLAFDVPGHGLSAVLARLLGSSVYGIRTAALELLARPDDSEEGVNQTAEEAVLALREEHPVASGRVLEVIGGERTCAVLLEELIKGGLEEPWVPVLIGLLPDGDPRLDELEASLLATSPCTERLWHAPRGKGRGMVRLAPGMDAQRLFIRLCATGSLTVVPDLLRILREHTQALGEAEDLWSPVASSRPVLSVPIVTALKELGKAVQRRGGLEPLIGHPVASDVPAAFVRWMLVRALEALEEPDRRALLVRSVPLEGLSASRLVAWGRTDDPELRRDVLERMGEHSDTVTLGAYALQAMADPDARIARAGARAAIQMRCPAAGPVLAQMLDRPRMDLKRVAARGLAVLGDGHAVKALVGWLGRHDNRGFRAELLEALQAVLPTGARGMLVAECRATKGRTAKLLLAAIACLDEPGAVRASPSADATVSTRVPFLFRAQTFANDAAPAALDALLDQPIGSLSVEAERVLAELEDQLFEVLLGPTPEDRQVREVRGRAARNLLRWSMKRTLGPANRASRIRQLRLLPTLPMGRVRWDSLLKADAVVTLEDLVQVLDDCAFTARRDAAMRSVLVETGVEPTVVHEIVAASTEERAALLVSIFAMRPVLGWTTEVGASWPSLSKTVAPVTAVGRAIDAGQNVPADWPWAPTCWDAVLRIGGHRRPSTHPMLLRGLFVEALADLPPTPDRIAWTSRWLDRPSAVDAWAGRVRPPNGPRVSRFAHGGMGSLDALLPAPNAEPRPEQTIDGALQLLATPGEERRGLRALERFAGTEAAVAVRPLLEDRQLRAPALRCFRRVASRTEVCDALRAMLHDRDDEWVRSCGRILGFMRDPLSVRVFVGLLSHRSAGVRRVAHDALLLVPDEAAAEVHRALRRARPDRRGLLHDALDALNAESDE